MDRRTFIENVGKTSVALAAAGVTLNAAKSTGQTTGTEAMDTPDDGAWESRLRLPRDLEKVTGGAANLKKPDGLTVACYTFPNYHPSAIHDKLYGEGWTEYNLVRPARPWFPGHQQPRGPLLGELDESKPSTWEKYNQLAAQHGIDVLIWDWYWYDDKPALHEALEDGFLKSSNCSDVKFACMWTNHPWYILYPTQKTNGEVDYPPSFEAPDKDLTTAWQSMTYIISRYFHLPNYWRINDKPVITIWDPNRLEKNLGLAVVTKLFADLRNFARNLGYPGIHFHITGFHTPNAKQAGYDTGGSYNPLDWSVKRFHPEEQELADYEVAAADVATKIWPEEHKRFGVPYIPALAPGWDSTPRYIMKNKRPESPKRSVWPGCTIFKNESPAAFKAFMQASFAYLNTHPDVPKIVTMACFNEWTEGHYLLPDNRFGFGMLDALAEALEIKGTHDLHGRS